jgi:hypothetical protein
MEEMNPQVLYSFSHRILTRQWGQLSRRNRRNDTQHQEWLYIGQERPYEQGLRRGVRTAGSRSYDHANTGHSFRYHISAV